MINTYQYRTKTFSWKSQKPLRMEREIHIFDIYKRFLSFLRKNLRQWLKFFWKRWCYCLCNGWCFETYAWKVNWKVRVCPMIIFAIEFWWFWHCVLSYCFFCIFYFVEYIYATLVRMQKDLIMPQYSANCWPTFEIADIFNKFKYGRWLLPSFGRYQHPVFFAMFRYRKGTMNWFVFWCIAKAGDYVKLHR